MAENDAPTLAARIRRGAGVFRLASRGLLVVEGRDRARWLDGMVSNEVTSLEPGPERSGCYALLLTPQGRIVSDLHVLQRGDAFWLELAAAAVGPVRERLEKLVISEDVRLSDASAATGRLAVEGSGAPDVLRRVLGGDPGLAPDCVGDGSIGGVAVAIAAFGWSGSPAFQLFAPAESLEMVAQALRLAAPELLEADESVLEILRVEAGIPRHGAELDTDVLPAEARLVDRAVSFTKGCYTGQEIVARMEARDRVGHRLVGLRFTSADLPAVAAPVARVGDDAVIGEVTSTARSSELGAIGLAYLRVPHAASGTRVVAGGEAAIVSDLPFAPDGGETPG
jgi:folate-binding protein YgfZ